MDRDNDRGWMTPLTLREAGVRVCEHPISRRRHYRTELEAASSRIRVECMDCGAQATDGPLTGGSIDTLRRARA